MSAERTPPAVLHVERIRVAQALGSSVVWPLLVDEIARELEKARMILENPGTDEAKTQFERGKIAAYKRILGLAKPPTPLIES